MIPLSRAYSLEPECILPEHESDTSLIQGVEACLWGELLAWPPRLMEYQLFPRLCALAEVGWSSRADRDFENFENRLYNAHFQRLYRMGIAFRVAPPEVTFDSQVLRVQPPHPSAVVRYSMDATAPTASSPVCRGEIVTDRPEDFRFATFFADDFGSIAVGASNIALYDYIEPEMTVESNFPLSDGNKRSLAGREGVGYSGRVLQAGDTLSFVMAQPVECSRITVTSGAPVNSITESWSSSRCLR